MAWGNEERAFGMTTLGAVSLGNAPTKSVDDRPELLVVDEMLSKALLSLDEELRLISNSVSALGGSWPTNGQSSSVPPQSGNVVATFRDRAEAAQRCASLAHELRERLQRLV